MTTIDCQTCIHILEIVTTTIATAYDKLNSPLLHQSIDSKPAITETAATAVYAARYHTLVHQYRRLFLFIYSIPTPTELN